ncbi:hypothetical protein BDV95DRAFT_505080 [Massariosphaeria phaeospora]|uniref:Fungal STAND N-terminal Goodbye domain-containing protein n=1 Tax=Massariosphaeria phaeospora TaxID=100035 RepID=A0A7C8MD51_9PLEO|nr:hypothetical protein BDV95DRAFT_505080 [Massariosphaeria phaeospora]
MAASKSKFEIIFAEGQKRYEKNTGTPLDTTLISNLSTVADVRNHIAGEIEKFVDFRDKNKKLYGALDSAFAPIERVGHFVAAGTSMSFPPAGACFGALALMIKSAQAVSAHYDKLLELFNIVSVCGRPLGSFSVTIALVIVTI